MDFYTLTAIKFVLGILVMIIQINIMGKYEFSVNTPLNQGQNFVLGGIIGGVIIQLFSLRAAIPDPCAYLVACGDLGKATDKQ